VTAKKKGKGGLSGESLGGMLAGFDQQIMRTLPPPHELVQKGAPVRGLSGDDAEDLVIVLSGEPPTATTADPAEPVSPAEPASPTATAADPASPAEPADPSDSADPE